MADLIVAKLRLKREREREQCIELLKAILKMDPNESITPREVLTHPFITTDYLK